MSKKSALPKKFRQAMREHARRFDRSNPGPMPHQWRFDVANANFDSAEGVFVARQLEFVRAGLYKVQYPDLKASRLLPYNMQVDTGAEQYTARSVDRAGTVKVGKMSSTDIPTLKLSVAEQSTGIYSLMLAYEYTIQDARNAMMAGTPLPTLLAEFTREEMERKLDDIAFQGDVPSGTLGLFTQTAGLSYSVPATGTSGSKTWDSKSSDDILLDLNGAPNQIVSTSKEKIRPDTWVLPTTARNLIATRRVGDGTSTTVLSYFLGNQENVKTVESTFKAEALGSGSTRRGACYKNDQSVIEVVVPQPFEQMQPVAEFFSVTTACHMRTAGTLLNQGYGLIYADGI